MDWKSTGGLACAAALLALSLPGVRAVRADATADAPADAAVCEVARQPQTARAPTAKSVQLRATPRANGEVVVLNNRGYNYDAMPSIDPAVLRDAKPADR